MKNAFALLMLSRGTPMMYSGDEFRNSQEGNNNACQDSPLLPGSAGRTWKGIPMCMNSSGT